jgi:pimeloyl-ACP methyl ester carboxylesterase
MSSVDRRDDVADQHELLTGFRLHSVDLPGFGGSDPLPGSSTLPTLADFVADFLDAGGESAARRTWSATRSAARSRCRSRCAIPTGCAAWCW